IVTVERNAGGVECARSFEVSGLDFEHIVPAVTTGIDPFADGIASESRLFVHRPIATVRVDTPIVMSVINQDVDVVGRDHDSQRGAPIRTHWPLRSGYFPKSNI